MQIKSEFFDGVIWIPKILNAPPHGQIKYSKVLAQPTRTHLARIPPIRGKSTRAPVRGNTISSPIPATNIVGNTAYFINTQTGETRSVYVSNEKLSSLRKEVSDWQAVHSKVRISKGVFIPKSEYTKLSRDPLAAFDFSGRSMRTGVVTSVLSADRIVLDNSIVVSISGVNAPKKEENYSQWKASKVFTESMVLGKSVYVNINANDPYAQNGDVHAWDVEVDKTSTNQQEEGWGAFDYLNIPGFAIGAAARNINILAKSGQFGNKGVGDRYSLSDTFTFTRLYLQATGQASELGDDSKNQAEGSWLEKLGIDIVFDPSNFVSIEAKGVSFAGRRLIKGMRYMKPLTTIASKMARMANAQVFKDAVKPHGLGRSLDTFNRGWRRVNMLLEPAYYSANTQLDLVNSLYIGGSNPIRLLDDSLIIKKASNPMFMNDIVIKPPGKAGITAKEYNALWKEFEHGGGSGGFADVANPNRNGGLWDRMWAKPIALASGLSAKVRRAAFLDGLKKGLDPAKAYKEAEHFVPAYDARELTAFEQAYANRIIPFYMPTKRNIQIQIEAMLKQPYKYTAVAKQQQQQRDFAGNDQFKDYDRNTIIQNIGNGRYIKLRFPLEDITQMPSRVATKGKVLLATTYPIVNTWFEMMDDENYFDKTMISNNYPEYLTKKFLSREYYMQRDLRNKNMPATEFVSKHVFGVSYITPDNKASYVESLTQAGYSVPDAQVKAELAMRRQTSFNLNAQRAAAFATLQASKPQSEQDRPINETELSKMEWLFSGLQHATTAPVYNLVEYLKTGKMGTKGIQDRLRPSDVDKQLGIQNFLDSFAPAYTGRITNLTGIRPGVPTVRYIMEDVILDLMNKVGVLFKGGSGGLIGGTETTLKSGQKILTGGKDVILTKEGIQVARKIMPITSSGAGPGLFGARWARIIEQREKGAFALFVKNNPGFAERFIGSRFAQPAGLQFFGRTFLRTDSVVQGARWLVPVTAGQKFYNKLSGATHPLTESVAKLFESPESQKVKWRTGIQEAIRAYNISLAQRKTAVRETERIYEEQVTIKLAQEAYATESQSKIRHIQEAYFADSSRPWWWYHHALTQKTSIKLTNFVEEKDSIVKLTIQPTKTEQDIVDDWVRESHIMANEETSRGLLTAVKQNYIMHIDIAKYRLLRGFHAKGYNPLMLEAPFAEHRGISGTVAEINAENLAKNSIEKFEPNFFIIKKIRKMEHIEVIEADNFLQKVVLEQGVSAYNPHNWFLKSYTTSKIPRLRGVLLPRDTVKALEQLPQTAYHIATMQPKPSLLLSASGFGDEVANFYRRMVIGLNLAFVPRNFQSSVHQNMQAGLYDFTRYAPKKALAPSDIEFVTAVGRPITRGELEQAYKDYKVTGQPGMGRSGIGVSQGYANAVDKFGNLQSWITLKMEDLFRTRLFDMKVQEGWSFEAAAEYVKLKHLDYAKKYNERMEMAAKFMMFPTWTLNAPEMIATSMMERPWLFAAQQKSADAWNSAEDKMMLQYKGEYLQETQLFKIPFTPDSFVAFPLSTSELTQYGNIFDTQHFEFNWNEALANPNILLRFAKNNLNVDWLQRGGGSAKAVSSGDIIITYAATGQSIRASVKSGRLRFTDVMDGTPLKDFEISSKGNKIKVFTQGEPFNELSRKTLLPAFSMAINMYTQSSMYKVTSAFEAFKQITGLGPAFNLIGLSIDDDIPYWQKLTRGLLGWTILNIHTTTGMEAPEKPAKIKHMDITPARERYERRYVSGGRYYR